MADYESEGKENLEWSLHEGQYWLFSITADTRSTKSVMKVAAILYLWQRDGSVCASVKQIAEEIHLSDRSIRGALAILQLAGWVQSHPRPGMANQYELTCDGEKESTPHDVVESLKLDRICRIAYKRRAVGDERRN